MNSALMKFVQQALGREPGLHPVDRGLAKRWIKQRLLALFPELRNDPHALDQAYHSLSLEPRLGTEEGDPGTYFEMKMPR